MGRYTIRFRIRRVSRQPFPVAEIWRLADEVRVYEAWGWPMGSGTAETYRVRKLLEAVPDDQAEGVLAELREKRLRAALDQLSSVVGKRRHREG